MEFTVKEIAAWLATMVGLIGGCEYIALRIKKIINSTVEPRLKKIEADTKEIQVDSCKNFLVKCFNDIENGTKLNAETEMRMYESYDKYTNVLHQNSYIHDKWDKLMEKKEV